MTNIAAVASGVNVSGVLDLMGEQPHLARKHLGSCALGTVGNLAYTAKQGGTVRASRAGVAWSEIRRTLAYQWANLKSYFISEPPEARAQRKGWNEVRACSRCIGNVLGSLTAKVDKRTRVLARDCDKSGIIEALKQLIDLPKGALDKPAMKKHCLDIYLRELSDEDLAALHEGVLGNPRARADLLHQVPSALHDLADEELDQIAKAVSRRFNRPPLERIVELLHARPVNKRKLKAALFKLAGELNKLTSDSRGIPVGSSAAALDIYIGRLAADQLHLLQALVPRVHTKPLSDSGLRVLDRSADLSLRNVPPDLRKQFTAKLWGPFINQFSAALERSEARIHSRRTANLLDSLMAKTDAATGQFVDPRDEAGATEALKQLIQSPNSAFEKTELRRACLDIHLSKLNDDDIAALNKGILSSERSRETVWRQMPAELHDQAARELELIAKAVSRRNNPTPIERIVELLQARPVDPQKLEAELFKLAGEVNELAMGGEVPLAADDAAAVAVHIERLPADQLRMLQALVPRRGEETPFSGGLNALWGYNENKAHALLMSISLAVYFH